MKLRKRRWIRMAVQATVMAWVPQALSASA